MSMKAANGMISLMARQIEQAIIHCTSPFVEVYLESMDCSVEIELAQLRRLQADIANHPDKEPDMSFDVLKKYLYNWKDANKFLACAGLRSSEKWVEEYHRCLRAS